MPRRRSKPGTLAELQAVWDKRLRKAGFRDIESRRSERLHTYCSSQTSSVNSGHRASAKSRIDRASYYRLAGIFLHEHPFNSEEDRRVWGMHAEGTSNRKVARKLREAFDPGAANTVEVEEGDAGERGSEPIRPQVKL